MNTLTTSNRKVEVDGLKLYFNVLKVEPSWKHVWLCVQVLIAVKALLWSVGDKVSLLVVAIVATWLIAVTQKF